MCVRVLCAHVHVLVQREDVEAFEAAGATAVLGKPLQWHVLESTVHHWLQYVRHPESRVSQGRD